MTAIPTKLYEAFEKIRLGKVEEGTRLFDRVDGFDVVKSIPLAELSYFRHDWKRGVLFLRDFLESEQDWETIRYIINRYRDHHLKVFLLCTCQLDSWAEHRIYLQQLRKKHDSSDNPHAKRWNNFNLYQQPISLISDPENTKRLLLESRPELKTEGKIDKEYLDREVKSAKTEYRSKQKHWKHRHHTIEGVVREAYSKASTENHITFYERYLDTV